MNSYALTLILKPDLGEKSHKEVLELTKKKFGKLEKEDLWGAKDLAYPIRHFKKGYYVHYLFGAESQEIAPLDKALKLEEDILRYLLVRI